MQMQTIRVLRNTPRVLAALPLLAMTALAAAAFVTPRVCQAQLVSRQREQLFRALLPDVDDEQLAAVLTDESLVWYDRDSMPRAYQLNNGRPASVNNGRPASVQSPSYNISADSSDNWKPHGSGGTPAAEYPWKHAGGTDRVPGLFTYRFVRLPKTGDGRRYPIVWYRRHLAGDDAVGFSWIFPVGTTVGEVMAQTAPDGNGYAFEIRTRTRRVGEWTMDAYRPFPTLRTLVERIKQLRPKWRDDAALAGWIRRVEQSAQLRTATVGDTNHPRMAFAPTTAVVDELPPLHHTLVAELLKTTPFKSAHGEIWRDGYRGPDVFAPTTRAAFHIVPKNYEAGFIEVSDRSCTRCHQTANMHADAFDMPRGWYGRVPGSDQIFSFHPFDPASIAYNGSSLPVRMRPELIQAGVLEQFDARRHPTTVYHMIGQE